MRRRDFFRWAGVGAFWGARAAARRAAVAGRPAGSGVGAIPRQAFRAFPAVPIAAATAEFPRAHEASLLPSIKGSGLLVFTREEPAERGAASRSELWRQHLDPQGQPLGPAQPLFSARGAPSGIMEFRLRQVAERASVSSVGRAGRLGPPSVTGGPSRPALPTAASSPALARLPNGRLGLLYSQAHGLEECRRFFCASADGGETWTDPVVVAEGNFRSGWHDRFTVHSSGRLLAPLQCSDNWSDHHFYAQVAGSDNLGRTWQLANRVESLPVGGRLGCGWLESGCTAPVIAERGDGTLLMSLRTAVGTQFGSESRDGGRTWSEARSLEVGSPMAAAHLSRIPGRDELLLVWNAPEGAAGGGLRTILAGVSRDGGRSWPLEDRKLLLHDPDRTADSPTVAYAGGEAWITVRRTAGRTPLQGPTSTELMRVPLDWMTS